MAIHRIRTNYYNPLILIMGLALLVLLIWIFVKGFAYSDTILFGIYSICIAVLGMLMLVALVYYSGLKYITVEITGDGISANWFYGWKATDVSIWGRRTDGFIPWQDIERIDDLPRNPMSWWNGFFIQAKSNKRYYWIGYMYFSDVPKAFKEMKEDFDAHYEDACIKGLIERKEKKEDKNCSLTDFPDI